jgi:hypothetical protein
MRDGNVEVSSAAAIDDLSYADADGQVYCICWIVNGGCDT